MKFTFGTIMGGNRPNTERKQGSVSGSILVAEIGPGAGPAKDLSILLLTKYQP